MATQLGKWAPLILIGGVLWFLSRDGRLTPVQDDNGAPLNGYLPPGAINGAGPAVIGGSISGVDVPVFPNDHSLGLYAHKVEKIAGASVQVEVAFNQGTTDFTGSPISWPVKIWVELGHDTGVWLPWGGTGGWDNMNDLLGGTGGDYTIQSPGLASGPRTWLFPLSVRDDPGQNWDVRVTMFMQGTTDVGTPNGTWQEVDRDTHEDAVRTITETGPAAYGGWLDDILVYQGQGQMKRLALGQQRSPWGTTRPEVRSWPRYNRNSHLPGVQIGVRQRGGRSAQGVGSRIFSV